MRFVRFAFAFLTPVVIASLSAGCGDPVPPTQQGAWNVNFLQSDASKCRIIGHNASIGAISATQKTSVVADGGQTVADGGDPAVQVICTVAGAGPFYVDGSVNRGARGLQIVIPKIDASARESSPALGSASYVDETTVTSYGSDKCQFYFEEEGARIAPGQVWLSFKCPEIVGRSLGAHCGLAESYAIFENCAQAVPTE